MIASLRFSEIAAEAKARLLALAVGIRLPADAAVELAVVALLPDGAGTGGLGLNLEQQDP